jgi:hypothetical protein
MNATQAPATVTIANVVYRTRVVGGLLQVLDPCSRCNGRGQVTFGVVLSSGRPTCFLCGGAQGVWITYDEMVAKAARKDKRVAAEARKKAVLAAKAADELTAWTSEQDATVIAGIRAATRGLLVEFAAQMANRPLSPRQMEVAARIVAENADRAVAAAAARIVATEVGHFAAVGTKVATTVEIVSVKSYDGDYGMRYLVTMRTPEGHVLKTWNSGAFGREVEKGQTVAIKATVKKHDEYQGVPQTELTRVVKAA